jgi:IS5 family transposase
MYRQLPPSVTQEWNMISSILEANPTVSERVWEDLTASRHGGPKKSAGAKGMTAEQVLRFAIVKMKRQLSYRDLRDRVADSIALRAFCLMGPEEVPAFTTLQENIKRIGPQTWEAVNRVIIEYACAKGVEDGRQVRIDTTGVETNLHHPTDSHQLWDSVRVLARILQGGETDIARLRGRFHDHRRAAKKAFFRIHNTRGQDKKKPLYKKLIHMAKRTVAYGRQALQELARDRCASFEEEVIAAQYGAQREQFLPRAEGSWARAVAGSYWARTSPRRRRCSPFSSLTPTSSKKGNAKSSTATESCSPAVRAISSSIP